MSAPAFITVDKGVMLNLESVYQIAVDMTATPPVVSFTTRPGGTSTGGTYRLTNPSTATVNAIKALDTMTSG